MAAMRLPWHLQVVLLLLLCWYSAAEDGGRRGRLAAMATESRDAVVTLTFSELEEFAAPGRDYDLVLLAQAGEAGVHAMGHVIITRLRQAASELEQNPSEQNERIVEMYQKDLQYLRHVPKIMVSQRREFGISAASYSEGLAGTPDEASLFFVTMVEDPETFRATALRLSLTQAIEVVYLPSSGGLRAVEENRIILKDHPETPWTAETIVDWLGRLSGKKVPVVRWSLFRQWWFPYLILTSLLGALYLGLWLAVSGIAGRPVVIAVGALAVWWFSTSGIMYNLIKKIPFVAVGPRGSEDAGKLLLYIAHPHMQLGAEGIAAGTAFLLVSMCMLGVTVWVPSLPGWGRSVAGQALVFLAGVMCVFLHDVFHQKLGQGIRSYIDVPGANFARGLLRLVPTDKLRPA